MPLRSRVFKFPTPFKGHSRERQVPAICCICGAVFTVPESCRDIAKYCRTRCRLADTNAGDAG